MFFSEFKKVVEENTEYPAQVKAIIDAADKYYKKSNNGNAVVSGSLELLVVLQNKEDAVLRNINSNNREKTIAENRLRSLTHVIQMISELSANDR